MVGCRRVTGKIRLAVTCIGGGDAPHAAAGRYRTGQPTQRDAHAHAALQNGYLQGLAAKGQHSVFSAAMLLPPALPQVGKDVRHGAYLVQHSGHLTGHQAAAYRVALKDGAAQAAQRVFFQFHLVRARLFLTDILPAHAVFSAHAPVHPQCVR